MEEAAILPRKTISKRGIVFLSLGDVARGMIGGIITTYLLTFFVVSEKDQANGMLLYLAQAGITMAIIRAIGMLFDGITDPICANFSDRCRNKNGRRIPFMKFAAIPYGLFCALIFFPPVHGASIWNAIWVGAAMFLYYSASTLYQVPYSALQAEITTDPKRRSFLYLISATIYVIASAVVYLTSIIKGALVGAGVSVEWAYRIPFLLFIAIGTICAAIPAFTIKENDFVTPKVCSFKIWESLKKTFKYKNFRIMVIGFLVMWISFGFFNAAMMYYISVVINLPDVWGTIIPAICIVITLACYPLVTKWTRKVGKRIPLCLAMICYALLYTLVYVCSLLDVANAPMTTKIIVGVIVGILDGAPLAATNTIPPAAIADCATYDTLVSGERKEGMFMAVKNFCMKVTQSLVLLVAPLVMVLRSSDNSTPTVFGVGLTALIAAIAALATVAIYAFYDEKDMKKKIEEAALAHEQEREAVQEGGSH